MRGNVVKSRCESNSGMARNHGRNVVQEFETSNVRHEIRDDKYDATNSGFDRIEVRVQSKKIWKAI